MEEKIGVFICSGYGIAEALDIDALCKVATGEFKVPFCKVVDSCEGPGLEAINQDIRKEGLTKVVIAGISPRRFADNAFPEGVIVEPVGIREQVVWSLPPNRRRHPDGRGGLPPHVHRQGERDGAPGALPTGSGDRQGHSGGGRWDRGHDGGQGSRRRRATR